MITRLSVIVRNLGLGLFLIAGAAGVLLYSDLGSRQRDEPADPGRPLRVALVQHASIPPLNDGITGVLAALERRGYVDGQRITVRRFNAEGDMATANTIAKDVTSSDYDLIISASTVSLQTIANANRFSTPARRHVFGLVSDPYAAGVGIDRDNHADHPPYMTGFGSLPPVADAFRLAKQMHPQLKRVGLVWNPTESNSVAATNLAREICKELGITLVEANAENATGVGESAASVLSRGVDAMWISPDVTVVTAADVLLAVSKRARVPVFSSLPGHADKGAVFDLGADYLEIGETQGNLAADVLDGRDPATVPVENFMPERFHVNVLALDGLRARWEVTDATRQRAHVLIDASGRHTQNVPVAGSAAAPARPLARRMAVDLIEYADTPNAEITREGLLAGFTKAGLEPGKDFELRRHTAQGDIATLSSIIDTALTQRSDLLLTLSTPSLQNALLRGRGMPIVFTMVGNPFIVKAGTSDTDHVPFVTGAYLNQPVQEMLDFMRQALPNVRRIGTLYTPAEINSVFVKEQLETAAKAAGLEFIAVGVASTSDVPDAAAALIARRLDALTQVTDNLISSAFPSLLLAANRVRLPVVTYSTLAAEQGAMLVVGRDYYDNGFESALLAARVLRGERTADIPFVSVPSLKYIVNLKVAEAYGIRIPPRLLAAPNQVIR